jgi:hypothetical protein
MNGPNRTGGDTLSPLEQALLDAGRTYHGSPEARAKTLAALGLATSAAAAASAAGAASVSSLSAAAKLTWTKVLLGAVLVGGVAVVPGGYYLLRHTPTSPASQARATTTAGASTVPGPLGPAPLGEELAEVDGARAALAAGDTRRALSLLAAYDRTHPHGRLELEAEVLRIDALARSGHPDAARARAEAFLRRHPTSVLAARARRYLGR